MSTLIHRSAAADAPNDEGKRKPQLLEQQADVVAGSAQHGDILMAINKNARGKLIACLVMSMHAHDCRSDKHFFFLISLSLNISVSLCYKEQRIF